LTALSSIEEFRSELDAAVSRAREVARGGRPSMRRVLTELETLQETTRAGAPPSGLRESIAFDVIAVRELEGEDDAYCEQLSRLAAFARAWPAG
jgi:hypothetical protein